MKVVVFFPAVGTKDIASSLSQKLRTRKGSGRYNFVHEFPFQELDKANDKAMPIESFRARVYEYWTKDDPNVKGKFMFGPFESENLQALEAKTKKK